VPSKQAGFYVLIAAQFASALADNALLLLVIALLQAQAQAAFWIPLIKVMFTLSYVLSGPWVGAWSDSRPKHGVMMRANGLKLAACIALLAGADPITAFAFTGLGAAMYAPAKYGLITELVPADELVHANAWIEVSAVCAALFGVMLGGALVSDTWLSSELCMYLKNALPFQQSFAVSMGVIGLLYLLAGALNTGIPDSGKRYADTGWHIREVWHSFINDQRTLWRDPLGGISLSVTSLFWGVGASMQLLVLAWAQNMLNLSLTQAAYLQASTAIGVVAGALLAARLIALQSAPKVLFTGVLLGLALPLMLAIDHWQWALLLTLGLGALSGFFVVPMNALLQARGAQLLSAGRSIAVQNTCENSSILLMLGAYSLLTFVNWPVQRVIVALAVLILIGMLHAWWRHQCLHIPSQ
jgi:LPLT family lysophospholipid transporter-like MFS transporter